MKENEPVQIPQEERQALTHLLCISKILWGPNPQDQHPASQQEFLGLSQCPRSRLPGDSQSISSWFQPWLCWCSGV